MENYEDIDIKRILEIIFSKKIFIILILLLTITLGYVYSYYYKQPEYKSSVTILLVADENKNNKELTQTDLNINSSLISTYSSIAKSTNVMQKTIDNLGLNMSASKLQKSVEATQINKTQFLKITVKNSSPETAKNIANELSKVFTEQIKEIYNLENISIVDGAEIENQPCNVNHIKDMAIFTFAGVFLSAVLVMAIYLFDDTIKDEKDIERNIKLKNIGTLPIDKENNELIIENNPKSHIVECIKTMRTNILYTTNQKTILITSSKPKEGKSWIINNLAIAFAQADKKVILVDTDLRKENNRNETLNVEKGEGLSDFIKEISNDKLENLKKSKKYIKETKIPNLHMLQNGTIPPNPVELISSDNMKKLLDLLKSMYDVILLDGTPCMVVSDSIALSSMVDGTILVAESKKTKINDLKKTKKLIEDVNGKILGVISNKSEMQKGKYYGKRYGYYYGNEAEEIGRIEEKQQSYTLDEIIEMAEEKIKYEDIVSEEVIGECITEENNITNENQQMKFIKDEIINEIRKIKNAFIEIKHDNAKKQIKQISEDINKLKQEQKINYDNSIKVINNKIEKNQEVYAETLESINKKIENNEEAYAETLESINKKIENNEEAYAETLESINKKIENNEEAYAETLESINKKIENNEEAYAETLESINKKIENNEEAYAETLESINKKIENNEEAYAETLESINKKIENNEEAYAETLESINRKIENNEEAYAETLESINKKIENNEEAYAETLESINKKIENNEEAYAETLESINKKIENNEEAYAETLESINRKIENNEEAYAETLESINKKIENNKEEYTKTVEEINNKLIKEKEEYAQIVEEIKEKENENLTAVIQQFISEINKLKGEIKNLKEAQANNNSELLDKIEKVNYEEKLAEINKKIEKINYEEKLTEINNKKQHESGVKIANNIINFETLKERRRANKKVFKINEEIKYEDLERLSTCIVNLNEDVTSVEVMSN